jgi:hypothetical protein
LVDLDADRLELPEKQFYFIVAVAGIAQRPSDLLGVVDGFEDRSELPLALGDDNSVSKYTHTRISPVKRSYQPACFRLS